MEKIVPNAAKGGTNFQMQGGQFGVVRFQTMFIATTFAQLSTVAVSNVELIDLISLLKATKKGAGPSWLILKRGGDPVSRTGACSCSSGAERIAFCPIFIYNSLMDPKELGQLGEQLACEYLVEKGFKIMFTNYRIKLGEIDIIAKKKWKLWGNNDKTIHFIEVKTIMEGNGNFFPEDRVDARKQKKLSDMAQLWLQKHKFSQRYPCQIDVIGVIIKSNGKRDISYVPNAMASI